MRRPATDPVVNPRRKALTLIAQLGAYYDEATGTIYPPTGHLFMANMAHKLTLTKPPGYTFVGHPYETWQDTVNHLTAGLAPCPDETCTACR